MQPDRIHRDKSTPSPPTRGEEKEMIRYQEECKQSFISRLQESEQGQLATAEHDMGDFPGWWGRAALHHGSTTGVPRHKSTWPLDTQLAQPFIISSDSFHEGSSALGRPLSKGWWQLTGTWSRISRRPLGSGDLQCVWSWSPLGIRYSFFWQDE